LVPAIFLWRLRGRVSPISQGNRLRRIAFSRRTALTVDGDAAQLAKRRALAQRGPPFCVLRGLMSIIAATAVDEAPATRFAKDQLKAIIERIERLEEEKKAIADDIRDVYAEAKGNGFDTKALRMVVRLRKQDKQEREEQEAILDTYLQALGMI
jgi:uncharacterized protein (UPF0335 family)